MSIYVRVAYSEKTDSKYLALYKKVDNTEKFVTCDFAVIKRLLGINRYTMIDKDYLSKYEVGEVLLACSEDKE